MTSLKTRTCHAAHKKLPAKSPPNAMSTKAKFLIQRICYKQTASVDMTKNGFIKYTSMIQPLKLLLRPLKEHINKILSPSFQSKQTGSTKSPSKRTASKRKRQKNSKVRESKQPKRKLVKKKKTKKIITKTIPKKTIK